jgi:hypothetical protein
LWLLGLRLLFGLELLLVELMLLASSMFGSAPFHLLYALLALGFLFGAPANSAAEAQARSLGWTAEPSESSPAKGASRQLKVLGAVSQQSNGDDAPDSLAEAGAIVSCPDVSASAHDHRAVDVIPRTHPACATPARAPPPNA